MVRRAAPLLAVLVLAGCGLRTVAAPPPAPAVVHDAWPGCATLVPDDGRGFGPAAQHPGSVPADFWPTRADSCDAGERTESDGDVVRVQLERTATDLAALLSYLARPSERPAPGSGDYSCSAVLIAPPALFLLDRDGRWIAPAVPTDVCDFPLDAFTEGGPAYARLAYTERVVRTLEVTQTAAAAQAGCSMQWKYVIAVEATDASPAAVTADPWPAGSLRRCLYAVPTAERGTDAPAGDFTAGGVLAPAVDAAVRRALVRSVPAEPCSQAAGSFVLLQPADRIEPIVYVELDGCRRVLIESQPHRLAQADPELVRQLS